MLAVERQRADGAAVAFVGEGYSDRFGAAFADVTFAKHHLAEICSADGIGFLPWGDFDDVRRGIEGFESGDSVLVRHVAPERCPGWSEPDAHRADTLEALTERARRVDTGR
jgi:hypothetical protein